MSYSKVNQEEESELALLSNEDSSSVAGSDDLEANRKDEQPTPTTEPEYQTPTSVKFMWLGSYFFFSMMLTLYNKLILGSVRPALEMMIESSADPWTIESTVQIPMALNMYAYNICLDRHLCSS